MKEWLIKNAPWLSSGIGVFLILGLGRIIKRTLGIRPKSPQMEPKKTVATQEPEMGLSNLNPFVISQTLEDAPLLQREFIARQFLKIPLEWKGEFIHITRTGGGMVKLLVSLSEGRRVVGVLFEVNPDDYPGIGLVKAKDKVHFRGIISDVHPDLIELKDAKIISLGNGLPSLRT